LNFLLKSGFISLFVLIISLLIFIDGYAIEAADYDTNDNTRIDHLEFFDAVHDWLNDIINNPTFFEVLDYWIGESPIMSAPLTPPPPQEPPDSTCPSSGRMIALRNGVPIVTAHDSVPDGAFSPPIDLAFASDVTLPRGTNVQLNITSNMPGLEPRNGALRSPIIPSPFFNLGPLTIVGNGTIRDGVTIIRSFEWATFRPFWTDGTTSGTFSARATINAPGCGAVVISGSVTLNRIAVATTSNIITIQYLKRNIITISSKSSRLLHFSLYDLNGSKVHESFGEGNSVFSTLTLPNQIPNGIYLISVKSADTYSQNIELGPIVVKVMR